MTRIRQGLAVPDGEYAAYAAYQGVIDRYGRVDPYVTIQASGQQHIEALVRQLERTGESPCRPTPTWARSPRRRA